MHFVDETAVKIKSLLFMFLCLTRSDMYQHFKLIRNFLLLKGKKFRSQIPFWGKYLCYHQQRNAK